MISPPAGRKLFLPQPVFGFARLRNPPGWAVWARRPPLPLHEQGFTHKHKSQGNCRNRSFALPSPQDLRPLFLQDLVSQSTCEALHPGKIRQISLHYPLLRDAIHRLTCWHSGRGSHLRFKPRREGKRTRRPGPVTSAAMCRDLPLQDPAGPVSAQDFSPDCKRGGQFRAFPAAGGRNSPSWW